MYGETAEFLISLINLCLFGIRSTSVKIRGEISVLGNVRKRSGLLQTRMHCPLVGVKINNCLVNELMGCVMRIH